MLMKHTGIINVNLKIKMECIVKHSHKFIILYFIISIKSNSQK